VKNVREFGWVRPVVAMALLLAATGPAKVTAAEAAATTPPVSAPAASGPAPVAESPDRVVRDGVVVDFSLRRAGDTAAKPAPLLEGDYAEIRFSMTDAASGKPVPGLKPAAWLDMANVIAGRAGEP
jgi:hypothetical protein